GRIELKAPHLLFEAGKLCDHTPFGFHQKGGPVIHQFIMAADLIGVHQSKVVVSGSARKDPVAPLTLTEARGAPVDDDQEIGAGFCHANEGVHLVVFPLIIPAVLAHKKSNAHPIYDEDLDAIATGFEVTALI